MPEKTIFKRIIDREIPAKIVFEDEQCLAFEDVHPAAPVHVLVIPKREIASVDEITAADAPLVGHLLAVMPTIAAQYGLSDGYRVVANCGRDAGQEVMRLHFRLLGGRRLTWPPG